MRGKLVKLQLMLLTGLLLVMMLVVGGAGYIGSSRLGGTLDAVVSKMGGLRLQMEADQMHDAIRADVMVAMYSAKTGNVDARGSVEADFHEHAGMFLEEVEKVRKFNISPEVNNIIEELTPALHQYVDGGNSLITLAFSDANAAAKQVPEFLALFSKLEVKMAEFSDLIEKAAGDATSAADTVSHEAVSLVEIVIAIGMFLGLLGAFKVLRSFRKEFSNIEEEFSGILKALEVKEAEASKRAEAASRVQQALDAATTNLVLTDASMQIIYVNKTARQMFSQVEAAIRQTMPAFSSLNMAGTRLEQLFPDAQTGRAICTTITHCEHEVVLGGKHFNVVSTPVHDDQGHKLGVVCEWKDQTEQREAESQIEAVLQDAINGQLDTRLDSKCFRGFMVTLSDSVNNMLDAITSPLRVAAQHLQKIAEGQIPQPITSEFKGEFNQIRNNLNTCSKVLNALITDTTMLVEAASNGQLHTRVDVSTHWGDYRKIVEGMNNTLDAIELPVTEVKEVITGFASGDLTRRMAGQYHGDFSVLCDAVNASIGNLVDTVHQINVAAYNLNTSASEISTGNQNLNERTQQQAAALEETTATLQNLNARAEENTANAKEANQLANMATCEATKGGVIVNNAVQAMADINAASSKIAEITSVIDSISFQTNLLALNASVEAARAGEEGRGFAVVANEVRALAQRSASAAQEIKLLVNDTVSKVNHGSRLVNESGTTLRDIVDSINKVETIITGIAASASEQMEGFQEVSLAINSLDDMTQQNAALVEEAAAASESMADQSNTMQELMGFFNTGDKSSVVTSTAITHKKPAKAAVSLAANSNKPQLKVIAAKKNVQPVSARPRAVKQAAGAGGGEGNTWSEF